LIIKTLLFSCQRTIRYKTIVLDRYNNLIFPISNAVEIKKKLFYIFSVMAVIHTDKDGFKKEVLDHKGLVLVYFYADWCGPCKITGPIIEELAKELTDIKFVKVNVDENQELTSTYQVFSIPTFMIFKDGQVANQFVGAMGKEGFLHEINQVKS